MRKRFLTFNTSIVSLFVEFFFYTTKYLFIECEEVFCVPILRVVVLKPISLVFLTRFSVKNNYS